MLDMRFIDAHKFTIFCRIVDDLIVCSICCDCRFIGALYGRVIGLVLVDIYGGIPREGDEVWEWIDPGAWALIGAASFFGGVARLTMSLTVIMVG